MRGANATKWISGVAVLLTVVGGAPSCSALNREGPLVTCDELGGGTSNACADGIIASCKDGANVTYQVCENDVDGTSAKDLCTASWQAPGNYACSDRNAGSSGGSNSSGGSPSGDGGSSSGGNSSSGGSSGDGGSSGGGTTTVSVSYNVTLSCASVTPPASVSWFDYDAGKALVASTSVETNATGTLSCTTGHLICLGGSAQDSTQITCSHVKSWGVCDCSYGQDACKHPGPVDRTSSATAQYCWTCAAGASFNKVLACTGL